jgi:hypothetical protein
MSIAVPFGMIQEAQLQHGPYSIRLSVSFHQQVDPYLYFDVLEFLCKHMSCKSFSYFVWAFDGVFSFLWEHFEPIAIVDERIGKLRKWKSVKLDWQTNQLVSVPFKSRVVVRTHENIVDLHQTKRTKSRFKISLLVYSLPLGLTVSAFAHSICLNCLFNFFEKFIVRCRILLFIHFFLELFILWIFSSCLTLDFEPYDISYGF